jgi:hypothetical protein
MWNYNTGIIRKFLIGGVIAMSVISCGKQIPPGGHNNFHSYDIRRATLHFEYFGNTRGTEDLYVDSFGVVEAHDAHFELLDPHGFRPTSTYSVKHGADVIEVDSVRQRTIHLVDHVLDSLYHLSPWDVPTPEQQFDSFFEAQGYYLRGDTTIVGLHAHLWQFGTEPRYLIEWGGMVIGKSEGYGMNGRELRLISVDTVHPIDPQRFVAPHGYRIEVPPKDEPQPRP